MAPPPAELPRITGSGCFAGNPYNLKLEEIFSDVSHGFDYALAMSEEPTPEFYRAEAKRVLSLAEKTHLPDVRERLLRVAQSYEDLAKQAETLIRP